MILVQLGYSEIAGVLVFRGAGDLGGQDCCIIYFVFNCLHITKHVCVVH